MIIQLLFLFILAALACVVAIQRITSAAIKLAVLCLLAIGAYFVLLPEHATAVARLLGIGRGADLILYFWVMVTLCMILLLYLKITELSRTITQIARHMAVSNPLYPRARPEENRSETRG